LGNNYSQGNETASARFSDESTNTLSVRIIHEEKRVGVMAQMFPGLGGSCAMGLWVNSFLDSGTSMVASGVTVKGWR
jgi:hypothetical protein